MSKDPPARAAGSLDFHAWGRAGSRLDVRDWKIFVRDVGSADAASADTLLLLHGFPESSHSFRHVVDGLSERFERVVLLDFLGFGWSDKPRRHFYSLIEQADLALAVWEELGIRGGHLLAHDMGDSVATELVYRMREAALPDWFADGIQSLTFTNGGMVLEHAKLRVTQRLLRLPVLGALLSQLVSYRSFAQQVRSASGSGRLQEEDVEELWKAVCESNGHRLGGRTLRYIDERRAYERERWLPPLRDCPVPIHLCWGMRDAVAPPTIALALRERYCPEAHWSPLDGVGHFAQIEAPEEWLQATLAFWAEGC